MTKLRVHGFCNSLDGYGADPRQDIDNPLGVGGAAVHEWACPTGRLAGRELEGLVGRQPGFPRAGLHFVTDGIDAGQKRATQSANGQDVRLGGGVATIQQYLRAGLIDEMHVAMAPTLLGSGEHLFSGLDAVALGYRPSQ